MVTKNKYDMSLSFIRVVAMCSIILCHIFNETKYFSLGQIFNVGVQIFIILSAYLYGKKNIIFPLKWLYTRFIRILIPMYIFMIFLFSVRYFLGYGIEWKKYIIYLLNLQEIFGGVTGAGHLWFLTPLMFCYFITPVLNSLKFKKYNIMCFCVFLFIIQVILSLYGNKIIYRDISLMLLFSIVYGYSVYANKKLSNKFLFFLIPAMLSIGSMRLICKYFLDGSYIYNTCITEYLQIALGICIFLFLKILFVYINKWNIPNINSIILYWDKISLYIYITHYMFFVGPFSIIKATPIFIINIFLALLFAWIFAVILKNITERVQILLI